MKCCFKCGQNKELTEFYKHPAMLDGHVNKCKDCNKKDNNLNRQSKIDYYREYDRDRFYTSDKRKEQHKAQCYKYSRVHADRRYAHTKARRALLANKLIKENCLMCGDSKTEMHHVDYSKPLEVMWLCKLCHERWHVENDKQKEVLNG